MVTGFILSILVALLIALVGVAVYGEHCYSTRSEVCCVIITVLLAISVVIGGTTIGYVVDCESNRQFMVGYAISKETIENSVTSNNLSGFERVELVKQAVELNSALAQLQYISQQWYGFAVPDEIIELKPIDFGG